MRTPTWLSWRHEKTLSLANSITADCCWKSLTLPKGIEELNILKVIIIFIYMAEFNWGLTLLYMWWVKKLRWSTASGTSFAEAQRKISSLMRIEPTISGLDHLTICLCKSRSVNIFSDTESMRSLNYKASHVLVHLYVVQIPWDLGLQVKTGQERAWLAANCAQVSQYYWPGAKEYTTA